MQEKDVLEVFIFDHPGIDGGFVPWFWPIWAIVDIKCED